MRFLYFLTALLILSSTTVTVTYAQGFVLSPKRIVLSDRERGAELRVINRSDEQQTYNIYVVNKKMMESGDLVDAEAPAPNEFFADEYVRFSPRRVTVEPRAQQKVRILSRLPGEAEEGEYRSHIVVEELPSAAPPQSAALENDNQLGLAVEAIFGVSIPVIIRKGSLEAKTRLENAKIVRNDRGTFVKVDVHNEGTRSVIGTAKVFTNGKEVGTLSKLAVYLSSPFRTTYIPIDTSIVTDTTGKTFTIQYAADGPDEDAPSAELSFVGG